MELKCLLVARKENLIGVSTGLTGQSKNLDPTDNPTGFHLCNVSPFEELLQRWQAVGNAVICPKFEPQTYHSRDERVTARPIFKTNYVGYQISKQKIIDFFSKIHGFENVRLSSSGEERLYT